jgi:3-hydroxypropanoate dehydrogenase
MTAVDDARTLAETAILDTDAMAALFRELRTARSFADRPVTDEDVAAVHDVIRWSPTAFNATPMRLLLVRTPEARRRLAEHMKSGNRERVLAAPLAVVVAADVDFHEHLDVLAPHMDPSRMAADPAFRETIARDNTWLQAGYLITGLRAAGMAVGPMSGMDPQGIDAEFFAGTGRRSVMVLTIGWPSNEQPRHPRAGRLDFDTVADVV